MSGTLTAAALAAVLLGAFHDTGIRLRRRTGDPVRRGFAFDATLGMAAWMAAGGLLNALGLAMTPLLAVLLLAAFGAAGLRLLAAARAGRTPSWPALGTLLPLLPLALAVAALLCLAMPSWSVNVFDDMRHYLVLPQRMLQTGTLAGTALDSLGVDALGAQSFMLGLVLLAAPPGFALLYDAVLCYLLAGLLLDAVGRRLGAPPTARFAVMGLYVVLDFQQLNTSATYSAAAVLLALLLAVLPRVPRVDDGAPPSRGTGIAVGLLLAALAALKMSHALHGLLIALAVGVVMALADRRAAARLALVAVPTAALALAPWLLLLARTHGGSIVAWLWGDAALPAVTRGDPLELLLARGTQYYAAPPEAYRWLVLLAVAGIALAMGRAALRRAAAALAATLLAVLAAVALLIAVSDVSLAFRLSAPELVVVALCCVQLAGAALPVAAAWRPARAASTAALLGACLLVAVGFWGWFAARALQVVEVGHVLAYPSSPELARDMRQALGDEARAYLRRLQAQVPPGAVLFAPVGLAPHFDFQRNTVITLHGTVLAAPWSPLRGNAGPQGLRALLERLQARHLLLQSGGIGERPREQLEAQRDQRLSAMMSEFATRELALADALQALAAQGREIHRDPVFRLLELPR